MEIIIICVGAFIFGVGFITGGGWQLSRQEKESRRRKTGGQNND